MRRSRVGDAFTQVVEIAGRRLEYSRVIDRRDASASIKRMLSVGDRVKLIRDRSQDNRDAYDRLLRYIERKGRDVGRKQIRKGWAKPYVYEVAFKRPGSYRRARDHARARDRGLWDRCGGDFHLPF